MKLSGGVHLTAIVCLSVFLLMAVVRTSPVTAVKRDVEDIQTGLENNTNTTDHSSENNTTINNNTTSSK